MPVSMAIVCLIIGLTRPVRWKALECIARSARMPSVSRNEQSKLISLSLSLSLTGAALERKSSPRSALGTGQCSRSMIGGTKVSQTTLPGVGGP